MNLFDAMIDQIRQAVRAEFAEALAKQDGRPKLLYTTGEAAQILNVPETWLATAAREGRLPVVRIGHYVRFKLSDLEHFIEEKKEGNEHAA